MTFDMLKTIGSASIVSALVVFTLGRFLDWWRRRKRAIGYLVGIDCELRLARECTEAYCKDAKEHWVWSPAYRIDLAFVDRHLSWLAGERFVKPNQIVQLHRFASRAAEFNRCLDSLASLTLSPDFNPAVHTGSTPAELETNRATGKANHLLGAIEGDKTGSIDLASQVVLSALAAICAKPG